MFAFTEQEITELNFDNRVKNIKKLLDIWTCRHLSLKGKVLILKSLILPQIQFLFTMIYTPENILKQVENLFYKFLWNGKPAKIKKTTIIAPISLGGLSMIDIFSVHRAAKCRIKRLNDETKGKWKSLFWNVLSIDKELLNKNINYQKITGKTKFHTQILAS